MIFRVAMNRGRCEWLIHDHEAGKILGSFKHLELRNVSGNFAAEKTATCIGWLFVEGEITHEGDRAVITG